MSLLPLRDYQAAGIDAVRDAWRGGMQRPAVVWPTGAGKTVGFAWLIDLFLRERPGSRVLVLAHRDELIEQAVAKIRSVAPDLLVGVVKANRNETRAQVVVASVQTLRKDARMRMLADVGLVVVDEAHHAAADSYLAILRHYGCLDGGNTLAVGFTATMSRGDDRALGSVWQDVVHVVPIGLLTERGFLVRARGRMVRVDDLNLSKIRKSGGDYQQSALGQAISDSLAPELIAKALVEEAVGRRTILFAPTVASADVIGDAIRSTGLRVGLVHARTPTDLRRSIVSDLRAGAIDVVTNCGVFTEGFDEPSVDCVVVARPTHHHGLWVQMIGRGLRTSPETGKTDCLVIDVVGASARHSLHTAIELFGEEPVERVEDETDFDLEDEEQVTAASGLGLEPEELYRGPVVVEDVDLMRGSVHQWLSTAGGVWFLPAGERYVVIVPAVVPGMYDVVAMNHGPGARWVMRNIGDRSYAMAWAEGEVTIAETMTARKERGWRLEAPSPKQVNYARRLGIRVVDGMSKGEVSNLMATKLASGRIDPAVYRLLQSYGRA